MSKSKTVYPSQVGIIIYDYLVRWGYDGLVADDGECGCALDELAQYECCDVMNCHPGYKVPCECGDGCDYHISMMKPSDA